MRWAAREAGAPGQLWMLNVVNWGALWILVPFAAGRGARRAGQAGGAAAAVGALEVLTYYGLANVAVFKLFWLVLGAGVCGVVGLLGHRSRSHPLVLLAVPALFVAEPFVWAAVFLVLGRGVAAGPLGSDLAEAAVGLVAVVGVGWGIRSRARGTVPN